MNSYSGIRVSLENKVLLVELDRPDQRNALNENMQTELYEVFQEAAVSPEMRAVILTGRGEAFSAGGDLSRFERDWDQREFRAHSHKLTQLISSIERIEKPVVSAINGLATGAGTQLALACDLRFASGNARFLLREGRIGLIPSHGGCVRLVKLVGLARARDILLGSEEISADEAFRYGLVTRVVSQDALLDEARAQLDQIFKRAPQTYGLAKRLLTLAASTDLENGLFAETLAQSLLIRTEDHKEGVRAARERRTPSFEGR